MTLWYALILASQIYSTDIKSYRKILARKSGPGVTGIAIDVLFQMEECVCTRSRFESFPISRLAQESAPFNRLSIHGFRLRISKISETQTMMKNEYLSTSNSDPPVTQPEGNAIFPCAKHQALRAF